MTRLMGRRTSSTQRISRVGVQSRRDTIGLPLTSAGLGIAQRRCTDTVPDLGSCLIENQHRDAPVSSGTFAERITKKQAAEWLLFKDFDVPKDIAELVQDRILSPEAASDNEPHSQNEKPYGKQCEPTENATGTQPKHTAAESPWWKDDEPTSESKFHGHGPVKASLTKMAQWLDADKRTLKKNNDGTWWIQKVHHRSYHFWFTSKEKYAEMNQKAIKESQRASNDTKEHQTT